MTSARVSELSTDQCLLPGPWGGGGGGVNFDGYYISGESLSQSLVVFDFFPAQEIIRLAFIPKVRMNNFQETLTQGSATAMAEATMTDQEELALPRFSQGLGSDQLRYLDIDDLDRRDLNNYF